MLMKQSINTDDSKDLPISLITEKHGRAILCDYLSRCTPDRAVRVRTQAGVIVLCSWARHFTLIVPLSTQVYKWVPANNAGGNPAMDKHPIQGQ